jgi:ppGpp synthetase/RelA/SpoT-type nucleotidyltranferase
MVHNQFQTDLVEHMWAHVDNSVASKNNDENPEENNA